MGGTGFLISQNRSAETLVMTTFTLSMMDQKRIIAVGRFKTAYCLFLLVSCKATVATSIPVMVIAHEISWSASFASWSCPRNFFAFTFVHCAGAFFLFMFFLTFLFGFLNFRCC